MDILNGRNLLVKAAKAEAGRWLLGQKQEPRPPLPRAGWCGSAKTLPVWRNGRRTGLKIVRMAIAGRFSRLLSKQDFARVFTLKFTFTYFYLVQLMCHFLQPKVAQKVAQKLHITHRTFRSMRLS